MNLMQTVRMAFKSIMNNKLRSILTMLGIIIGVASVIAIVAFIQGASTLQRLQYEALGVNRIDTGGWGAKNQDWDEFEEYLDTELADKVAAWSPQFQYIDWQNEGVQYRGQKLTNDTSYTYVYFGNQDYGKVTNHVISAGRDISETDCTSRARVCVIGETIRKYFFGAMSPLGQKLRIGGKSFEIIGVYEGKYGGKINTEDQLIVMPYTLQSVMMSVVGSSDRQYQYVIQAADTDDLEELTDTLLPEFMQSRCEESGGYFYANSNSLMQAQTASGANMMALLLGGIAGISLLVGGIGIMNIMLMSVTERTREIGIRMAIGARKRDIISQFLIESAVVSCFGGVIGIVLGCFLSAILGNLLLSQIEADYLPTIEQFTVLPSFGLILGAFLFSALLGIIFGLYPANKASNLQPVDALRTQ